MGRLAIKVTGGGGGGLQLVCGRPNLAFSSALVHQTFSCLVCEKESVTNCKENNKIFVQDIHSHLDGIILTSTHIYLVTMFSVLQNHIL